MSIIDRTKEILTYSPLRLPRKIKQLKRFKINITQLEKYLDDLKFIDSKEPELSKTR